MRDSWWNNGLYEGHEMVLCILSVVSHDLYERILIPSCRKYPLTPESLASWLVKQHCRFTCVSKEILRDMKKMSNMIYLSYQLWMLL